MILALRMIKSPLQPVVVQRVAGSSPVTHPKESGGSGPWTPRAIGPYSSDVHHWTLSPGATSRSGLALSSVVVPSIGTHRFVAAEKRPQPATPSAGHIGVHAKAVRL